MGARLVLPPPQHDPDDVRRALDDVLSRPELRPEPRSLLDQLRDWVLDRLGEVIEALLEGGAGSVLGWLVVVLLLAGAGVAVARLARGMRPDAAAPRPSVLPSGRSAAEWLAEAAALEQAGHWRRALRCRYRGLVAALAEAGVVDDVPGRTAGEYRFDLRRSRPAVSADFTAATELFELAWYGHRPTGDGESERFQGLARSVLAGARG